MKYVRNIAAQLKYVQGCQIGETLKSPRFRKRGLVEALAYADAVGSKAQEPAAVRLQACGNYDPLGRRRDAFGQIYVPAAFALVYL